MKITDRFPMLTVVTADLVERVQKYDNYRGRVWYKPSTWKKPDAPIFRICTELERGLRGYGQDYHGLMGAMGSVFRACGYSNSVFPLQDAANFSGHWRGTAGVRRRELLDKVHAHLSELEFGSLTPPNYKVGEILA